MHVSFIDIYNILLATSLSSITYFNFTLDWINAKNVYINLKT